MDTIKNTPVANPSIVFREEFDDWVLLFDPDSSDSYGINPVGAYIWKMLSGKNSVEDIVTAVKSTFEDAPDNSEEEIAMFIDALVEKGYASFEVI